VVPFGGCVAQTGAAPNNIVIQYYRNTLDSLVTTSVWVGDTLTSHPYVVEVRDSVTGARVAYNLDFHAPQNWAWLNIPLTKDAQPVRGRTYKIIMTRLGGGAISFAFDPTSPYKYGSAYVPGSVPTLPDSADLALRVCGFHDRIDSTAFGADDVSWWASLNHDSINDRDTLTFDPAQFRQNVLDAKVRTMRVDLDWNLVQYDSRDSWHWELMDAQMHGECADAGCRPLALLFQTTGWASTRIDSVWTDTTPHDTIPDSVWVEVTSLHCAPRCLNYGVSSDSNYLARFIDSVVHHYDALNMPIHDWEIYNEPNDTTSDSCYTGRNGNTGWWRRPKGPNRYYTLGPGLLPLCSLYMRMAQVVDSAVKHSGHPGHDTDKVAIGSMHKLFLDGGEGSGLVSGKRWLDTCYAAAQQMGMGKFWDAVSMHPYMPASHDTCLFALDTFEDFAESLRCIMRRHGDHGEVWNTEFSTPALCWWDTTHWLHPVTTEEQSANNCCEMFTLAEGMKGQPGGSFDRNYWWNLKQPWHNTGCWGLMGDSAMPLHAEFYAFKQTAEQLTGKRLNGRVTTSDSSVRVYEFEDTSSLKKTWVCWKTNDGGPEAVVQLPARTDSASLVALDYGDHGPPNMRQANSYGWLSIGAAGRPQFVTEPPSMPVSRPDLVVDSIMVPACAQVGSVMDIHALVKNIGSDTTPDTVALDFLCDDSVFRHATSDWRMAPGDSDDISFEINPIPRWMGGWHLFSARVNPGQKYVEKVSMDDNSGYLRRCIRRPPDGRVDVIVSPLCKAGAPILPLRLESHSWESDSTGQTPADSARVLFVSYGQGDSVVHATDTTAWFPFCTDTVLRFPRGCAVYRVYAQYRDSGGNNSPFYGDSTDSIVVFDTLPPGGSIIIEDGGRFVSNSACTLRLAASDSSSGVARMRFINSSGQSPFGYSPFGLVRNGGFTATEGLWDFTNGAYDTSLSMGKLSVGQTQAFVRQFIAPESIAAHAGDSCVLEASILAHVHDDGASGSLSFWYYSTRVDSENLHDSLFMLVDSAEFSGDLLSLTGLSSLSKRFLLSPPSSDSVWVWKGGMVKVQAQGVGDGVGTIWCDNVFMNAYEPQASGYAWWAPYDSLCPEWGIGSTAGQHVVGAVFLDSAGTENMVPYADTVILDPVAPVVDISLPHEGFIVDGLVEITGWAYDPVEGSGGEFFESRRLFYRSADSTNWLPVDPDSVSYQPAYPDSMSSQGPAVHLGYWNTLLLENAPYYLMLTASDSAGNTSSCTTWVMVDHGFGGGGNFCSGPEGGGTGLGEGSCYVGSATGTVLHLSDDLTVLDTFAVADSGSEACVTAILKVESDSILVLDAHNKRVHKLHKDGQHRRRLVSNLSEPADLKRDENGNLWLADRGISKIGKFRPDGSLVFTKGGLGKDSLHFDSPEGIAVKGNLVYVADTKNDRIVVWDTCGKYRAVIKGKFAQPTAVFAADNGAIYLTDGSDGRLKGITRLGGNIVTIATSDSSKLKGLVPSENRHSLFSIAAGPNKVYKLRIQSDDSLPEGVQSGGKVNLPKKLSLSQPFPNPARTRLSIAYALPRQTQVALKVYDVAGKLVKALVNGEQKPGYYSLTWNRQDAKGRTCACGVYFCTLAAENQRFSRKVILTE